MNKYICRLCSRVLFKFISDVSLKNKYFSGVDIDGSPSKIKYERQFSTETTRKYSCATVHWKTFVDTLREIYGRILEINRK